MRLPVRLLLVFLPAFSGCDSGGGKRTTVCWLLVPPSDPRCGHGGELYGRGHGSGGEVESFQWEFGDGESAEGRTPTHTFEAPGSYNVTVTVTDDRNATDSARKTVDLQ